MYTSFVTLSVTAVEARMLDFDGDAAAAISAQLPGSISLPEEPPAKVPLAAERSLSLKPTMWPPGLSAASDDQSIVPVRAGVGMSFPFSASKQLDLERSLGSCIGTRYDCVSHGVVANAGRSAAKALDTPNANTRTHVAHNTRNARRTRPEPREAVVCRGGLGQTFMRGKPPCSSGARGRAGCESTPNVCRVR